ncbi:MAG TPA: hypothetical protein VNW46_19805 [Gemmatimonadaceae bacterium]|nr:hypothetical protein [Gemmatimonadaceae bacterium]
MMTLLAVRNFFYKPWRSALLFFGFGLGVSVMIILLSIGDAMVVQSEQERLVGGGSIAVLPEGIDIEVMKTGGLGGLFFSVPNARFLDLQLLGSQRLAPFVRAVAPQIDEQLLYLRTSDGVERTVRASADIPSAQRAVGAAPALAAGEWADDSVDRRWVAPTAAALENDIDHFHLPPAGIAGLETWAEWHYFNVVSADRRKWAFITLLVGGKEMRGQVIVAMHEAIGGRDRSRRFTATVRPTDVQFSTTAAELHVGESSVMVRADGRYVVHAQAKEQGTGARVAVDLVITPSPGAYFPGSNIASGDFVSGYTVPALRADASGTLCIDQQCEEWQDVQSYHDHNWGVWRGVTWEWGAARLGRFAVLYGRVQPPDSIGATAPLFVYLVDSLGFRTVFRPERIIYDDSNVINIDGQAVHVPAHAVMTDVRGADSLRLDLDVEAATGTRVQDRQLGHPYFIQMKGLAHLSGRAAGGILEGEGVGFFETYR